MKRLIVSLLMVIGIQISSFSQSTYPKRILWGSDTILAITRPQLVMINRSLNDYIHLKSVNKNLQMDIRVSDSLCLYWENLSKLRVKELQLKDKQFEESRKANDHLKKSIKQQKIKSRRVIIGVGVGGSVLGLLLGTLLR